MTEGAFTIGTDQEMFVKKNSDYVSAIPLVKGTKEEPEPLPSGGTIQHDNVAVEFAIDPAASKKDFIQKIGNALQETLNYLPEGMEVDIIPSAVFPKDQLLDKAAKEAGCDPDFDAWTRKENKPPQGFAKQTLRSCGGHAHTGFVEGSGNDFLKSEIGKIHTIKMFDLFHGSISTVLDADRAAIRRRTIYGKPGCYRPTDYGVEYRTLSNFWIKSPQLVALIYHLTEDVLRLIREKKGVKLLSAAVPTSLQNIILKGKVAKAMALIRSTLLEHMSDASKSLFDICFFNSITYDPEKEWKLT